MNPTRENNTWLNNDRKKRDADEKGKKYLRQSH